MLLILAGVTIVTLTGDNGILTKATEAKDKTEEGEEDEKVKLSVAGALAKDNGGEIKEGYLDEELASQFGEKVRNLTIEDIEEQMNETGKSVRNNYKDNSSGTQYGSTKTYNGQNKYPNLYALENGSGIDTEKVKDNGIGVSEEYYKEPTKEKSEITSSELTVTQTYYRMNFQRDYLKKPEVYDMIFEGCYWLASRYVDCNEDGAYFELYYIGSSETLDYAMVISDGRESYEDRMNIGIRPVVSLGSDIQIIPVGNADGSSLSNMHQISKQ